jgi:DNA-binding transcriptional MerR regulator
MMDDKEILKSEYPWGFKSTFCLAEIRELMQKARQDEREKIKKAVIASKFDAGNHPTYETVAQEEIKKLEAEIANLKNLLRKQQFLTVEAVDIGKELKARWEKSIKLIEFKRDECSDHIRFCKDITKEEKERCCHALSALNQIHLFMQEFSSGGSEMCPDCNVPMKKEVIHVVPSGGEVSTRLQTVRKVDAVPESTSDKATAVQLGVKTPKPELRTVPKVSDWKRG